MKRPIAVALAALPILLALLTWLSPLAFIPVPWPDDSAFYFVAKDFFQWPPRWVMLPQAPFEPTYRIFNFNTMPLYPILIGLGRFVGIDGSFALKFWPLSAWALSGSLLAWVLYRRGLPALLVAVVALGFGLDPVLRWASVLVRPESLIGLAGMALVLGLSFNGAQGGFPRRFEARKLWDPVAALLAIGAYAHFNAVHLLFPVLLTLALRPREFVKRSWQIGWKTVLYLTPWFLTILWHPKLFVHQMTTQWKRLAVGNGWLSSVDTALRTLFENMGTPVEWPQSLRWAAVALWALIFAALIGGLVVPFVRAGMRRFAEEDAKPGSISLVPAAAWVLGSCWLWHSKPEVWFTYYIHLALWCFAGVALLKAWEALKTAKATSLRLAQAALASLSAIALFLTGMFAYATTSQLQLLNQSQSWRWQTYYRLIDCIDEQLVALEQRLGSPRPFRVWDPTFPDVTIELSRRHPDWEFTRTNDFWERQDLAIEHGREVEAVVVPETINHTERYVSGPASAYPEIQSVWMTWRDYFLHRLNDLPGWKPNRYICQMGRWQAFIYMSK